MPGEEGLLCIPPFPSGKSAISEYSPLAILSPGKGRQRKDFSSRKTACVTSHTAGCDEFGSLLVLGLSGSTPGSQTLPALGCMLGSLPPV